MKHILIIEDDPAILRGLVLALEAEHYKATGAIYGMQGYETAKRGNIDLLILDLILPDMNGYEICERLRKDGFQMPIIMLTCKGDEVDRIMGLELGADDYVVKPFGIRELLARVRARLRRTSDRIRDPEECRFDHVYIDFRRRVFVKDERPIKFTPKEFKILKMLIRHEGEVVSRHSLLDEAWGQEEFPSTRTIDNFILSLRRKIEDNPSEPKHFLTIHTEGYKFVR